MKEFTWETFPRKLLKRAEWRPFPGIFPTRWAIDMKWGETRRGGYAHHWQYIGKPNQTVAQRLSQVLQNSPWSYIRVWEFTRNGAISQGRSYGPRGFMSVHDWNQPLCKVVDPWTGTANTQMITHWSTGRMQPLPLTYKGHKFVIYADPTRIDEGRFMAYKTWLDAANIKF